MRISRNHAPKALLLALEADAASARSGFACRFSTADEYEAALITARRAQGRYHRRNPWPVVAFLGGALALVIVGAALRAG
jgi:NaMN:DMB phosphoribosyltransferase